MSKMLLKSLLNTISDRALWVALPIGVISLLVACGPAIGPEEVVPTPIIESNDSADLIDSSQSQADESAYPPPVELPAVEEPYPGEPLPTPSPTLIPDSYPVEEEVFAEPRFRIDLPLTQDDQVVTGQAPANLALAVVDVSSGGLLLGSGVSTNDGQFSIGVPGLPDGHRIGITFSDLEPGKTYADMSREYFPHRGEGFINVPNIGIFFDSALVGE